MVDIIRLHGDPHRQTQRLLPWYATGVLDDDDIALVETHLPDCAECRIDLKLERALGREIGRLPMGEERGWSALRDRLESPSPTRRWLAPLAAFKRPIPVGWAILAQAASLILVVGLIGAWVTHAPPRYVTLGSAPTESAGNVVVMFKPTTTEEQLRAALLQNGARLVDGPTASDAYILHVAAKRRSDALGRLKSDPHVELAEPIDGPGQP